MVEELAAAKNMITSVGYDLDSLPRKAGILDARLAETQTHISRWNTRLAASEGAPSWTGR